MSADPSRHKTEDDQRLLSGKRRAPRRRRSVSINCIGPSGRCFSGRTVDISRGGMLVEITDPEFQPIEESSELLPFAARIALQFPNGMDVNFGDGAVQVHANVVRLVSRQGKGAGMLLGCKFVPSLSDFDCRLLGIDPGTDETTAPATALVADAAHPKAPAHPHAAPFSPSYSAAPPPAAAASTADADAAKAASHHLLRGSEELRTLIGIAESRWKDDPASTPAPKANVTSFERGGRREREEPRAVPAAEPLPEPADEPGTIEDEGAAVQAVSRPPGSRQPSLSTWAPEGTLVIHLFPANAPLHGPRFMGRLLDVRVRAALVELPAPEDEDDAGAWAAALGTSVRAVCLRDGRVLWETRARVMHVCASDTPGWARATLLAAKAPPLYARRLLGHAAVGV